MSKVEVYYARERPLGAANIVVWDYVVEIDSGHTMPVGYCTGWVERTREEYLAEFGWYDGESLYEVQEAKRPWKRKYHSDGHATQELAALCYREYRVDQELIFSPLSPHQAQGAHLCKVCSAPAVFVTDFIGGGDPLCYFCAVHANRETVMLLFPMDASPRRIIFY